MRISRAITDLFWKPGALPAAALAMHPLLAGGLGAIGWAVALTVPLFGGGLDEPYTSWPAYLDDTCGFATFWVLIAALPVAVASVFLVFTASCSARVESAQYKVLLLAPVPFVAPLLARLPHQLVCRSRGQINPPPPWTLRLDWALVGSSWWLVLFFVLALVSVVHAWRTLSMDGGRASRGCCTACANEPWSLGVCPECGAPRANAPRSS